jgi:transcriptional regulator with XRE-family HTH domain
MDNFSKKERINMVYSSLKENGEIHSQAELAKAIGASEATISKALKGEEKALTDNLFKRISKRFARYSLDWMINGIGNMLNGCGCTSPDDPSLYGKTPSASGTIGSTDLQRTHNGGTTEELLKENTMLKELLAEKERTIQILLKDKQ